MPEPVHDNLPANPSERDVAAAREILRRAGENDARADAPRLPVGPLKYFRLKQGYGSHQCHGRTYTGGEIVATDVDLLNTRMGDKFEPATKADHDLQEGNREQQPREFIPQTTPTEDTTADPSLVNQKGYDTLNSMSVADLKRQAAQDEVDLKGATTKSDIIKRIIEVTNGN